MQQPAKFWHLENDRIRCDLCPRECLLKEGQNGFCFVRKNIDNKFYLTTYGQNSGMAVDPIEKKPLYHFYPSSKVLSFGTAGCNLGCRFCQNWGMSKAKETSRLSVRAMPVDIPAIAIEYGCESVAFTYNDPVIFAEYAVDTAIELHKNGLKAVAVTAGYINEEARKYLFAEMDAANVDLKGFSEVFYRKNCFAKLKPVLDTLVYLVNETDVWVEITNLIIPGENDSPEEIDQMTKWIVKELGANVPLHFSAFHPDFKMLDKPRTGLKILQSARKIAIENGLHYVYTGNVVDPDGGNTNCPNCQKTLIKRGWFDVSLNIITSSKCPDCGHIISGLFKN